MDESSLKQSLELYQMQLSQIEQAISAAGETEELIKLRSDLQELITLTEGSLLSLKKSQLLKSIEDAERTADTSAEGAVGAAPSSDDEYAAFQAALNDTGPTETSASTNAASSAIGENCSRAKSSVHMNALPYSLEAHEQSTDSSGDSDDETANESALDKELSNLTGMKCRAPFAHDWGKLDYHNALVMSAERETDADQIWVKVMFTTPTHISMLPCKFYLDGHCRFSDDKCRFSHGHKVELELLREYEEVDHSSVAVDTKCLAQYTDSVWYPATVTDLKDDAVSVHFDDYGEDLEVDISQIVPAVVHEDSASDSEGEGQRDGPSTPSEGTSLLQDSEDDDEELPVFLWKPPQTTAAVGEWEAHTRGIGSKLMSKMGYVPGQGLGVDGQGKAEPVPILLLPQGKSLDRIMELKELAGNSDLFNAMKKLEKQKAKADKRREQQAAAEASGQGQGRANVFDFINKKLAGKRGDLTTLGAARGGHHPSAPAGDHSRAQANKRSISEHELHKRSDRDINVQVFKTHEEIRNVERQLDRLRESLARNENKDRNMAAQVRKRLSEQEAYLASLKSSSTALEKHQRKRSDCKKLTVF